MKFPVSRSLLRRGFCPVLAVAASLTVSSALQAQTDDFNDGNDVGWTQYDPLGAGVMVPLASYSFPSGGYRIQASRLASIPAAYGAARAGSLITNQTYTDFYIAVDLVNWNNSLDQAFGILARITDAGPGTTDGYVFSYQNLDTDISISKITNEGVNDLAGSSKDITLDPNKDYRFVFLGRGSYFEGRVYELPNITTPIITTSGTDTMYPGGVAGLLVANLGSSTTGSADATFDNYLALDIEPPRIDIADFTPGPNDLILTWPGYASNFILECSSVLPNATWTPVTDPIFAPHTHVFFPDNPNYLCFTTAGPGNKYFRLRRP